MTKQEFAVCMGVLESAFPRTGKLNPQQAAVWFSNLEDLTVEQLRNAVTVAIRQGDDWPTISKLRRYSGADGIPAKDRPLVAWNAVQEARIRLSEYDSPDFSDATVNAVIRQLGGWPHVCDTPLDKLHFLRNDFCAAYSALCNVQLANEQTARLPGVPGLPARFRRVKDRDGNHVTIDEWADVRCLTEPGTAAEPITKRLEVRRMEPPKIETTKQSPEAERYNLALRRGWYAKDMGADGKSAEQVAELKTKIVQADERIAELDVLIAEATERRFDWIDRLRETAHSARQALAASMKVDETDDDSADD